MGMNRKFSLELDSANPAANHAYKRNNQTADIIQPSDVNSALNSGQWTPIGVLYTGSFDETTGAMADASLTTSLTCVVLSVGGTTYKICS